VIQLGKSILRNKGIAYELTDLQDKAPIRDWVYQDNLSIRLIRFARFMAYMIENELIFYTSAKTEATLNGGDFMSKILLSKAKFKSNGQLCSKAYVQQSNTLMRHMTLRNEKKNSPKKYNNLKTKRSLLKFFVKRLRILTNSLN
jgi:hypothetical protein